MEYRFLGKTGARVSAVCLGTVFFGTQVPEAEAERVIHRALDLGVTFLDTAELYMRPRYGAAEEIVGKALVGRRHEVFLATKKRYDPAAFRTGTPADHGSARGQIMAAIEGSLCRLRTDYIDLYYPHQVDPEVGLDETLRAFEDLVRSGKVRYVGLSNHRAWQVVQALALAERNGYAPISCAQVLYNLLDRSIEHELVPCCQEYGIGLVPYSPLAGGVLSAKYGTSGEAVPPDSRAALGSFRTEGRPGHIPVLSDRNLRVARRLADLAALRGQSAAALALRWVLQHPSISSVILGASTVAQLEANIAATEVSLSAEDLAAIATCAEES